MDEYYAPQGVVDPEVRAYVYSLVSALGGTGAEEDGRYVLGDDALACLKDIKRWLRLYDEKLHRLDVARCLAEANLVKGDLLEILASWPEDEEEDKIRAKIALACLELLVPLTWPVEKNELQVTANHYQHMPYLQLAQIGYKRDILEHWSTAILRTSIRIGLPSIALPISERTQRDEGIIKLLLYFLRNVVMISAPPNLPVEWNENEVSRSATVDAFQAQDVFALLLTIASNIGEDFNTQDVVLLEILFHLLKGVNVEKLFMDELQVDQQNSTDLQGLMAKEAAMLRGYSKNAPTRHNRFGTMIWVKRDNEKVSTLSGQDVLADGQHALSKMDKSKKWNKPRRNAKEQRTHNHFDLVIPLSKTAKQNLRKFVEDFLDSGFNPLFGHLRKAIEREAERVLEAHTQQFLYLIGWFLEAERVRQKNKRQADRQKQTAQATESEEDGYGLIAAVLNQETFILINRNMQEWMDHKMWRELDAGMRCFTQILLTVQEMSESNVDEDQEIAENIQNRIFYEETTHDRVVTLLRTFKDQGFSYLDACTEFAHVFLRTLERYSKENIDLQIRSKRQARKKKKKEAAQNQKEGAMIEHDSEAEEEVELARVSRERKFDFKRFAAKFITQSCVDTFVTLTTFYKDLTTEQLKRAHRYFYRVAFKQEMGVMLFRLDIVSLFYRMIKGPEGLNTASPMFKEWQELAKQVFRRLVKKMSERPELAVELLFSKINSTTYYLEYGYEKQTYSATPRAPAELEVRDVVGRDEQIAVVVAAMVTTDVESVTFVERAVQSAASERQSWEAEAAARALETEPQEGQDPSQEGEDPSPSEKAESKSSSIVLRPDSEPRRLALFKNAKLRLLLSLIGLERLGEPSDPDSPWLFPSHLSSTSLHAAHSAIEKARLHPPGFGEDSSIPAEEMLRRKRPGAISGEGGGANGYGGIFGSDSSDDDGNGEDPYAAEDAAIVARADAVLDSLSYPATRKRRVLKNIRQQRRRHRRPHHDPSNSDEDEDGGAELSDATRAERRKKRLMNDLERRAKIKSTEFVHDSDDEEDAERDREFFAREVERGKGQAERVREELLRMGGLRGKGKKKRGSDGLKDDGEENEGEGDEDEERVGERINRKKRKLGALERGVWESDSEGEAQGMDHSVDEEMEGERRARRNGEWDSSEEDEDEERKGDDETPLSSQTEGGDSAVGKKVESEKPPAAAATDVMGEGSEAEEEGERLKSRRRGKENALEGQKDMMDIDVADVADEEEDEITSSRRGRAQRRAAVLEDSDDE